MEDRSVFLLASFAAMGVASTALKYVYQRPRPSIQWLIDTIGYSFPSWHTASTMMIAGAIVIVLQQRMKRDWPELQCKPFSFSFLYWLPYLVSILGYTTQPILSEVGYWLSHFYKPCTHFTIRNGLNGDSKASRNNKIRATFRLLFCYF